MSLTLYLSAFILFIGSELKSTDGASWSYHNGHGDGPSDWSKNYEQCGRSQQSPIDIKPESATEKNMGDFVFVGYDSTTNNYNYKVVNNGHTVQLGVVGGEMTVTGGELPSDSPFKLAQFHVHWGSKNDVGSEHTVSGKFYPLEIHLVHYNTKYANISEAIKNSDGLAVLGIFAEVSNTSNADLQKFVESFSKVTNAETETNIRAFPLKGLLPLNTGEFTRYEGSLTTPPCLEVVTWTVFKNPITISQTQLNAFRSLNHNIAGMHQEPLVNNYRPVQPINSRKVKRSYRITPSNAAQHSATATILFGMVFASAFTFSR